MNCIKCSAELPDGSVFCCYCGRKQIREKSRKLRGNGQGSVYKRSNGKWTAAVTVGYYTGADGKRHCKHRTKDFATKRDAVAALPTLKNTKAREKKATFGAVYEKWLPTHNAGKSTMDCYTAAYKYLEDVRFMQIDDIDIDDLQECIDTCGKGKRTQENIRCVVSLVYKYALPRGYLTEKLNLADYLKVDTSGAPAHRASFNDIEIEKIRQVIGTVWGADYVYAMIYLGFRPSEFLALTRDSYDPNRRAFIGGGKTAAGTDRTVTVSPKIQPYIDNILKYKSKGAMFPRETGEAYSLRLFSDVFLAVLSAAGIDNPMVEVGGGFQRHKYTPHSCRHTFSTLMKRVSGSDKDKLELIGHTSTEMLRYYQDVELEDLRRITDAI